MRAAGIWRRLAALAARAADRKKAENIVLIDARRRSGITDYLLLATVASPAQLDAVEDEVRRVFEEAGAGLVHRDGRASRLWRILDYGTIMVHIMDPEARRFYQLERLFHDSPRRAWEAPPGTAGAPGRKPPS